MPARPGAWHRMLVRDNFPPMSAMRPCLVMAFAAARLKDSPVETDESVRHFGERTPQAKGSMAQMLGGPESMVINKLDTGFHRCDGAKVPCIFAPD